MNRALKAVICLSCLLIPAAPALAGDVHLSVAASLKDVITELSAGFRKEHPDVTFLGNFGGSGSLAKQIANGAPADIFVSANPKWMAYLQDAKLVDAAGIRVFAYNTLVFAGGADRKAASMRDLVTLERIAIGSPMSVPAGEYAMAALRGAGIDRQLGKKLVMARDVRECLMYAERGEVDGAFVYKTDAVLAKRAKILFTVPQELYPRVTYPMALTTAGTKNRSAAAFLKYLESAEAKTVLDRYGFAVR